MKFGIMAMGKMTLRICGDYHSECRYAECRGTKKSGQTKERNKFTLFFIAQFPIRELGGMPSHSRITPPPHPNTGVPL
jgi:hypothetical protein